MKICVGSFEKSLFDIVRVRCMAINSSLKMLCRLGSRIANLIFFSWLYVS